MNENLKIGSIYEYHIIDESGVYDFTICGKLVYNDGVFAILKVRNRDYECDNLVVNYSEIKELFTEFYDPNANDQSEYVCINSDTETLVPL